mmetsp:Transcript_7657/g.18482  ORF Transcript_7657/g.18482 Transcript_7657/m.18482 type:complete len:213 (+) Transcript_7657:115-753(+)
MGSRASRRRIRVSYLAGFDRTRHRVQPGRRGERGRSPTRRRADAGLAARALRGAGASAGSRADLHRGLLHLEARLLVRVVGVRTVREDQLHGRLHLRLHLARVNPNRLHSALYKSAVPLLGIDTSALRGLEQQAVEADVRRARERAEARAPVRLVHVPVPRIALCEDLGDRGGELRGVGGLRVVGEPLGGRRALGRVGGQRVHRGGRHEGSD